MPVRLLTAIVLGFIGSLATGVGYKFRYHRFYSQPKQKKTIIKCK